MNEVRIIANPYNKLPYELQRYTYSFIYPDVRLACGFPDDESIYNLLRMLVETYTSFSTNTIEMLSNIYYRYFPGDSIYYSVNDLVWKYLFPVFDKDDRGRRMYWYEETADTDYDGFINDLYEKIIYEKNNSNDTKSMYKIMASYQYHLTHSDEYCNMIMIEGGDY